MAFASPGVSIKEIDLTPTVNVSDQNIGAVVIAAESGPVDEVIYVTSEKELVEIFGKPNEKNYESWFAANTIIQYGGIAAVVRPSGSSSGLLTANSDGLTNLLVKNKTQFEKYSEPGNTVNFKFAARTAGSRFNALKVVAVDHGADQVINYNLTTGKITTIGTATGTARTTYNGVSGTVTGSVAGNGATFNVTVSGSTYSVTVVTPGTNYSAGEQSVTIPGTSLGGTSPTNDLSLGVTVIGGAISNLVGVTGTAKTSYTGVPLGSGGATATINKSGTTYTATLTAGGENYTAPTSITVLGSLVGGTDGTNNVTIPVTAVVEDPTVDAGDVVVIKNGVTTVGTGWVYKIDTTNNKLYLTLNDSTKRVPSDSNTYSITNNAGTPVTLIAAGDIASVENDYYDTLEYAPGLKWRDIAPQPGTSFGVQKLGGRFDEMHILVLDEQGTIAGERNAIIEKYTFVSKAKDGGNLDGALTYFHDVISQKSTYIYPGAGTGINFYSASSLPLDNVTLPGSSSSTVTGTIADGAASSKDRLYTLIAYNDPSDSPDGGISSSIGFTFLSAATTSKETGSNYTAADLTSAIETGYDIFSDAEEFNDIDFLIPGTMSGQLINRLITIAEARRDCMVVASPSRSSVTGSETTTQKTDLIVDFFANINRSSFAILDSGYKYIYDKYNQKYRFVPCAADVAGLCISTTINSETWFSPAGYNRGNLRNATKLAYSPKQSERDRLYNNAINPIVSFPGQGIVLFGDKTALNSTSAFSRINVRRLFVEIEKNIARFAKFQLFEVNDDVTRSSFKAAVEPYLRGVQGRRGIYDFLVVCDETNNTSDVIDRNEFNAEIYIQPARSINYITITFIATRTGVSFGELTQ